VRVYRFPRLRPTFHPASAADLAVPLDVSGPILDSFLAVLVRDGEISLPTFKDNHGPSREDVIPPLEYFNRIGVIYRHGAARFLARQRDAGPVRRASPSTRWPPEPWAGCLPFPQSRLADRNAGDAPADQVGGATTGEWSRPRGARAGGK
jgi:hypothetical protein